MKLLSILFKKLAYTQPLTQSSHPLVRNQNSANPGRVELRKIRVSSESIRHISEGIMDPDELCTMYRI